MTPLPEDDLPDSLIEAVISRLHGEHSAMPQRVGKYRVEGILGSGGMGRVWLARDGERRVAIKTMAPAWQRSDEALQRLEREARALAALQHPHVCRVLDWVRVDDRPYIVMEFIDGTTLAEKLAQASETGAGLDPLDSLRWAEQTARALHAAHRMGILHRDVKPANLMVRSDGQVVLVDFGVAWTAEAPRQDLMGSRLGIGTLPYMSPQQLDGQPPDARTDIWSLGVTLFELWNGRRPFRGGSPHEIEAAIRRAAVPRSQRRARIRRDLDSVLRMAMAREPTMRYPSALLLAEDLQRLRERRPVVARHEGPFERSWIELKRRPRAVLGVLVALLLAAISLGSYASSVAARSNAVHESLQANCWNLRADVTLQRRRYDEMFARGLDVAAATHELERWLEDDVPRIARMRGELEQSVRHADPEVATLAGDEVERARQFERAEVALARERLTWARCQQRAVVEPGADWLTALRANRDVLERAQYGLVPLGPDPLSGCWEFAHLRSGVPPRRDAAGRLQITHETGLVFVLVRGGHSRIGDDRGQVAVHLAPYFLSKYEMSREQWMRLAAQWPLRAGDESERSREWSDPCFCRGPASPHGPRAVLPVFNVGWVFCEALLHREGLALPTEAQWEAAARGGTTTNVWSEAFGIDRAEAVNDGWRNLWRDGEGGPMPVDALLPNPLGFHHMVGNVWEWCRDAANPYEPVGPMRPGDGLQFNPRERERLFRIDRGGGYGDVGASVDTRNAGDPPCVWNNEGVRPALAIDP